MQKSLFFPKRSRSSKAQTMLSLITCLTALAINLLLSGTNASMVIAATISPEPLEPQGTAGLDHNLKTFRPGQEPVVVPPISFIDVNSGRFGRLDLDLLDGQFLDAAVDKLHLSAKNLDVQEGLLQALSINIDGGHLKDFTFDKLTLNTEGNLRFDAGVFLNHHLLKFTAPAEAEVTAIISQASLNRFLNQPKTLERLSLKPGKTITALAGLMGVDPKTVGLNLTEVNLVLAKKNQVQVDFQTSLGIGEVGIPLTGSIQGILNLNNGWLDVSDAHLTTAGQEVPSNLTQGLLNKIKGIPGSLQKSEDIRFHFTQLKVIAHKRIELAGHAQIIQLHFGGSK